MMNLQTVLSASDQERVSRLTKLRFDVNVDLKTPEALILWEQRMLDSTIITRLCVETYRMLGLPTNLQQLSPSYIPAGILNKFIGFDCVPIRYNVSMDAVIVGILPERPVKPIIVDNMNVSTVYVPLHYYVGLYTKYYGRPRFLLPIPITEKSDMIIAEAVTLGASDITISSVASGSSVYYNVRKKKVYSQRQLEKQDVATLVSYFAEKAGSAMDMTIRNNIPRYFSVDLDIHHRGRVVVNTTYYGYSITIRVLSNDVLDVSLESLNIEEDSCTFMRNVVLSQEKGLRIVIGETGSGKNTTVLACLRELVLKDKFKIVSLEQPVEILIDGVEQINAETDEEFQMNADSLLRSNPDVLYFTEITAHTAEAILKASNTGKVVFTSVHANTISDVISRLVDITGMSTDRLVSTIQSCVYQELRRDEEQDKVFPYNRYVHFTDDLKYKLYGQDLASIRKILWEEESKTI